jgi:hypothetical protein
VRGYVALAAVLVVCAGCSAPSVSPEPDPGGQATVSPEPDTGVQVLAKADEWRALLGFHGVVEVAYDEVTAAQAWAENVPADLVRRTGDPALPGLYGDLADIDFDREALVVYSSGQSGTCPEWLTGIELTEQGTVQLTTTSTPTLFGTNTASCSRSTATGCHRPAGCRRRGCNSTMNNLSAAGWSPPTPHQPADPPQRLRPASITVLTFGVRPQQGPDRTRRHRRPRLLRRHPRVHRLTTPPGGPHPSQGAGRLTSEEDTV